MSKGATTVGAPPLLELPVESSLPESPELNPRTIVEVPREVFGSPKPDRPDIDQIPLIRAASSPRPETELRDELFERVATFRRKRAHLRGFDPDSTLEFDFSGAQAEEEAEGRGVLAAGRLGEAGQEDQRLGLILDGHAEEGRDADSVAFQKEQGAEWQFAAARPGRAPMPAVMQSSVSSPTSSHLGSEHPTLRVASLSQRFLAGLLDMLALVFVMVLFVSVFFWAGGHAHIRPLTLWIGASVAGFFLLSYFSLFSTLCFCTPGQAYMGLSVRSLDGSPPTPGQSFWRGFGYSVSASAFMLGFVWALVDSDGLTWHDRMSGTFLGTGA